MNEISVKNIIEHAQSHIIGLDAMTGKQLFDTRKNTSEFVEKYHSGNVSAIWSEGRSEGNTFHNRIIPVIVMYISHNSWLESEAERSENL